jgi:hypothetical protein
MKKKQNYNVEVGSVVFYDKDADKKFKLENGTKFTKKWMGQTFRFKI